MNKMKLIYSICLFLLVAIVVSSCSAYTPKPEKLTGTLKIAVMNQNSYYETVGKILPLHFQNINFEVVKVQPGAPDRISEQIDELKPDIITFLTPVYYVTMLERDSLLDLSSLIKRDHFDLDQMYPPVIRFLKEISGGGIFGLTPIFNSTAIFYNIDLFNKYGVPYPTDRMSWEELYQLAARFPAGEEDTRIYGFRYYGNISSQLSLLTQAEHLSYFDSSMENLQMNTAPWRRLFQSVVDWNKKGVVYTNANDIFVEGKAAMTLGDPSYISVLKEKGNNVNWGIVTTPSNSQDREVNHAISLNDIYSINAKANSPTLAWEILKFVNGGDVAKIQFKSLSTRMFYSKEKAGVSLEPFYRLNMDSFGTYESIRRRAVPENFVGGLFKLIDLKAEAAIKEELPPEKALEQIQAEGQLLLMSSKAP